MKFNTETNEEILRRMKNTSAVNRMKRDSAKRRTNRELRKQETNRRLRVQERNRRLRIQGKEDLMESMKFEASQRKCGACGETGHNARTCKSKLVPFSTGGYWNEFNFNMQNIEETEVKKGFPLVDGSHVAMISKIVDGEVLKEPNSGVRIPNITWNEEPIKTTWGELDEKCKKQNLVSIGESMYSGAYLRGALAYLPKNTVLTLYTGVHYPLKATFEYGGEEWIFFLAPRVENYYAETFDVEFNDWAKQEMMSHGKNISFEDWAKDEGMKHGNTELTDWAQHEDESHDARYGSESLDMKKAQGSDMKYQNYGMGAETFEARGKLNPGYTCGGCMKRIETGHNSWEDFHKDNSAKGSQCPGVVKLTRKPNRNPQYAPCLTVLCPSCEGSPCNAKKHYNKEPNVKNVEKWIRNAETFDAQIGYSGARSFLRTMNGRVEGANEEGYFPADEEDFQEFVLDTIEDHIEMEDWNERYGAETLSMKNLGAVAVGGALGIALVGLFTGKNLLTDMTSKLSKASEAKKDCHSCNTNGSVRKNHTQVLSSEYSVGQINPVEVEGQQDIHGAEGVNNPRFAPSPSPAPHRAKSSKWL